MKTGRKHKIPILKSRLQETDRSWTDSTEQYASKEECIKSRKFTQGFKDCKKVKRKTKFQRKI